MTQIQGSFVLTDDIEDNGIEHMSDAGACALVPTDPTDPELIALLQSIQSSVIDEFDLSTLLPSDDEDDGSQQRPQTTTRAVFQNDPFDSDLGSDEENEKSKNQTSKELYLSNCKKYGVLPSSIFTNIIDTSNPSVVVRYSAMRPLHVKVMIPSLKMSNIVTKLDLSGNGFGSIGAIYLAKLIEYNRCITELNLSDNDIGLKGCKALCDALCSCHSISTLILDGNRLDDKCAVHTADLIASHEHLLHVSLSKNLFESISTARLLSAALIDNQSIEHFNISFNHFHQKTTGVFIHFLSKNFRLRSLNLSCSGFGLDASKAFSVAMKTKNSKLEELDLSLNLIDDECAKYLSDVLSINQSLKKLNLMQNPLSADGCYTLLKPLERMTTSQLEIIDIRDIYIKNQAFIDLANYLEDRFPKLVIRRREKFIYPPQKK